MCINFHPGLALPFWRFGSSMESSRVSRVTFVPPKISISRKQRERAPIGRTRACAPSLKDTSTSLSLIDKSARLGVHFVAEAIDCCDLRVLSC